MSPSERPPSLLALPSYLVSKVARYGHRHLEEQLAQHDMVLAHHAVMTALDDFGPLSQQRLADCLDIDKSHLVGPLDYLESLDLVERATDPTDRRRHRVSLTSEGLAVLDGLRTAIERSQQAFLQSLSESERETLTALLRRTLDANDAARLVTGSDARRPR